MQQRKLFAVAKGKKEPPKPEKKVCTNSHIYELIRQRRLQMLVHSCIYYRLNTSLITDKEFDTWARELKRLQEENPDISSQVEWYNEFKDWDGTTGFHLPLNHPWVLSTAYMLLNYDERRRRRG